MICNLWEATLRRSGKRVKGHAPGVSEQPRSGYEANGKNPLHGFVGNPTSGFTPGVFFYPRYAV